MSTKTVDSLTFETLVGLFSFKGFYTLGFSFIFGMCESTHCQCRIRPDVSHNGHSTVGDIHRRLEGLLCSFSPDLTCSPGIIASRVLRESPVRLRL